MYRLKRFFHGQANNSNFPQLNIDTETDVLIIGGGVVAALTAYILNEQNVKNIVLHNDVYSKNKLYNLDTQMNELLSQLSISESLDTFIYLFDIIYKLDDITKHIDPMGEFLRKPAISYQGNDGEFTSKTNVGVSIFNNMFSYTSGSFINLNRLSTSILKYCSDDMTTVYNNTKVVGYNFNNQSIDVVTDNGKTIKCKRIVFSSYDEAEIFLNEELLNRDEESTYIRNERINYHFLKNNTIEYNINAHLTPHNLPLIIGQHDLYPNIYFNTSEDDLLYGLIGTMYLTNHYFNKIELHYSV